ncbi:MAG TPA: Na(+)-translocating NADH-quinone reductase subunit A [Candidatus Cryptobacteroides merdipullorum]|uniref:Na(+)-translocating NADH-quinone reductase subunit A n=1 Tax=Candidatus Cryptobacteroides merdipullorum TaxID=2840771 RepID=A0A9D1GPE5_9BACT|nr:Na(+)-translocating NADH-quinone reductase subunit A [Candidatus Cryptobacteroides merdipullorum]
MSQNIVLKKGLNIPISGEAELRVSKAIAPGITAVRPTDFKGLLPRLLVKEGDSVLCGSPVIADKKNPDILLTSPVSGTVKALVRGEKRKLLAVLIESDGAQKCVDFGVKDPSAMDAGQVKAALLESGLWPWIIQRPYGIIADPSVRPSGIFVSAFDSAPLAADADFCFTDEIKNIQAGINAVAKLTDGEVHVSYNADGDPASALRKLTGVHAHFFKGKHPAGNVGVQISHIKPICKGDTVWTVSLLGLAAIGKLFTKGRYDVRRKVAVCGPMAIEPSYVETLPGMPMKELAGFYGSNAAEVRFVSGNVLSGSNEGVDGYLGYFSNQVTLLREGTERELLGWLRPLRWKQFSTDHSYFSWLMPKRQYDMDTNLHGGPRAFLMNDGYYAKVLPMDIYPIYLTKACLAGEIEKMEQFGIYEVLPEDLAVCEFVDPSKNNIQEIIEKGIDLMIKEMA